MAALLAGLAGCGGVRLDDGRYVVSWKGYRVGAPGGWTQIESDADVALRRADISAGLMAHATCEGKPPVRPLPVLVRHLRFGLRDVQDLVESPVTLGGLPGTAHRFRATLDGVPVAVQAVTLRGAGCVYDLIGVAPPDRVAALAPDFERFSTGFALGGVAR
ncbi:MAG TPA: hypothetical protein VHF87_11860 [Methylomirabilota bacterium]|nr:hypothetical protein [Methylomirabilota bacterium]